MTMKLFWQALLKFFCGVVIVGVLLFLPAGTFDYWNAWLLIGILFLSMPLVLGSLLSFIIFLAYPAIIAKRIRNEEKVLETRLPGYSDYEKKVRYRLIPFVW